MNGKNWMKTWILFFIIVGTIAVAFTYLIDPYGENYHFNKRGINKIKIRQDERQLKFDYLNVNSNYTSIILGNSKGTYLDPDIIKHYTGLEAYNASFSGGTMDEFLEYTKWLINNRNIKQLFIAFEYFALSEFVSNGVMPPELRKNNPYKFNYISPSRIVDSMKTVLHNILNNKEVGNEEKFYLDKGMRYDPSYFEIKKSIKKQSKHIEDFKTKDIVWHGKQISEIQINNLKEIVALCKENNVKLFLLQTPNSYLKLNYNDKENYKRLLSLIKIIAKEIHPVYFFNDFNYVNYNLNYFKDHSHFNYDVGKLIFKKVFLDEGIGVEVTPNNIYKIDRLIKLK